MARRGEVAELPSWPLGLLLVGYPVWWALGFSWLAVIGSALVMLVLLVQRRRVEIPPGLAIWAVFLAFATAAAVELDNAFKLVGFGVRFCNYLGSTVVFLYVYNARRSLPPTKIFGYVGCFFATIATGGWLGVLLPHAQLPTLAEKILPAGIRNNSLVTALVHPAFAELQHPYGSPIAFARPSAPFPYTNSWGCNVALLFPLLIAGIITAESTRRRVVFLGLLGYAAVPAAATLNRGMFVAIALSLAYAAIVYAMRGRIGAFLALLFLGVAGYVAAVSTGVFALLSARLQYSQTNAGRVEIYREAWEGTLQSPLFGNGAPRPSDVLDISIGTQGEIWNIMYSYGFPALICFVGFFAYVALRTLRPPTLAGVWLHVMIVVVIVTFVYYGYDGPQLSVAMLGAGLALRPSAAGAMGREAAPANRIPVGARAATARE